MQLHFIPLYDIACALYSALHCIYQCLFYNMILFEGQLRLLQVNECVFITFNLFVLFRYIRCIFCTFINPLANSGHFYDH